MNIDKLKSFYATVKKGSVKEAAQICGFSVSGITRHISSLEEEVGHKLFNNINQRLTLTNKGEIFFEHVGKILAEIDAAIRCLDEDGNSVSGELALNISAVLTGIGIIDYVSSFITQFPSLNVKIICSDQDIDLSMREADVAIRAAMDSSIGITQEYLASCPIHIFASKEYVKEKGLPKTAEELLQHRLITHMPTDNANLRHLNWHAHMLDQRSISSISINSGVGVLAAIESGLGIGTVSELALKGARTELVRVFPHITSPEIDLYFAYPEQFGVTSRIKILRNHLVSVFSKSSYAKITAAN